MTKNSQIDNEEINLTELMFIVWKGKWKIAIAVIISLIALTGYQSTKVNNFTAINEIKPISYSELNRYLTFNNLIINANANAISNSNPNFSSTSNEDVKVNNDAKIAGKLSKITSSKIFDLYLDVLEDKSVFADAMIKFNLLEASQYNNDQEYNDAITKLASSIKIFSPIATVSAKKGNLETSYHTINFVHHDAEKWKSLLMYVDESASKIAKKILVEKYNSTLSFLQKKRKYELQDITIKINNYLIDYEREVSDHLAYLREQAAIAKRLGIAKNTIEVQTFGNQNASVSNIQTDSSFYLRGYEAIDKEIELIELRNNKKAFIKGLFKLEKKKRAIKQDQTIERIKLIFQSDLLADSKKFSAGSIKATTTKFEYNDNKNMLVMTIVIALMAGIFYVIISNEFQSQRVSRKKTN